MPEGQTWVPAEGTIVARGSKTIVGFAKTCIVDLRPVEGDPFQAEVHVPWSLRGMESIQPQIGEVTAFRVFPKNRHVEFDLSDERNILALREKKVNEQRREEARRAAGDTSGAKWVVPAECPNCGARVEQAVACFEVKPRCSYCNQPLPVEPVR